VTARFRALLADERGFTLAEVLVASVLGVIVLGAAFTVMEVAFRGTARIEQRVDIAQRGRLAMETITKQLRSQVCLGPGSPALTQADGTSMTFYADIGDEQFKPEKRRLIYSSGAISEEVYPWVSGTLPNAIFSATATRKRTLITGVAPNGSTKVFRYFAFTTTDPVRPTQELGATAPLTAQELSRAVEIDISFLAQPLKGDPNDRVRTVFVNKVVARTSDAGDPERSPQCI
jgi:prepilin-type N-terminal cleavage/methylation domain-containing protein